MKNRRLRIVTVYARHPRSEDVEQGVLVPTTMAYIRWFKISEKLARLGHHVDLAVTDGIDWAHAPGTNGSSNGHPSVGRVPLSRVDWESYDVVKTLFHRGFDTLEAYGGAGHPFIVSKLGSVVAPRDTEGIYFYGAIREQLYATQEKIARASRYVTVLTPAARSLWQDCFGARDNVLLVPGAVDGDIPTAGDDPYPADGKVRVLFAGNVYHHDSQPEANRVLIDKLNRLGELLAKHGAQLYMLGAGELSKLDRGFVRYLGAVEYERTWDYFHHADVGAVVAAGPFNHNNESTKIYHYLRAGLPIVSEAGFPNDHVVGESGLGFVVPSGDMQRLADAALEAARRDWDREQGIRYVVENHTWERRVETYGELFARHFGG